MAQNKWDSLLVFQGLHVCHLIIVLHRIGHLT